jgi:hypothetical protein
LLGIAEILHVDLEAEIRRKMSVNQHRQYADVDGINTRISDQ